MVGRFPPRLCASPGGNASRAESVEPGRKKVLEFAAARIENFHALQDRRSWSFAEADGTILGQIVRPVQTVGIYVPGGKAAYPSSVLMNAIPARVAGVSNIIMTSPTPRGISILLSWSLHRLRASTPSLRLEALRPSGRWPLAPP